jgi:hypothetical protein
MFGKPYSALNYKAELTASSPVGNLTRAGTSKALKKYTKR